MVRSILTLGLMLWLVAAPAWAQNGHTPALSAEAVLLLDSGGKVLFSRNAAEDHAPASLVKLMTLYLAYEELESGRAQWEEPVTISRRAAETPRYRMGLRAGETVSLGTLLEGVAIASANDAATAVSEHLGGAEEEFVIRMNAKAAGLGLASTHFANAHGLPDPQQRTTAQDIATLIGRLVQDHPTSRTVLGGKNFIYRGRVYSRRIPLFDDPGGVQALKTGFTNEAGYNLAVAAWRAGQRFLLVVLGAQTRSLSFRDAKRLLQYGFSANGLELGEEPRRPAPARRLLPRRPSASLSTAG
ncbi:MAG: D-alanyl-D-alanine carboxypeptidase [Candidatus Rokubacteria bacterium]|nr:D-alanyl-D-alanine carboxypeptidase [Candidatus Rokubacteria bacterium]